MKRKVLVVKPHELPTIEILNTDDIREVIDGYIERVHDRDANLVYMVNDAGMLMDLPYNFSIEGFNRWTNEPEPIHFFGTVVIGLPDRLEEWDGLASFSDERAEELKNIFTRNVKKHIATQRLEELQLKALQEGSTAEILNEMIVILNDLYSNHYSEDEKVTEEKTMIFIGPHGDPIEIKFPIGTPLEVIQNTIEQFTE